MGEHITKPQQGVWLILAAAVLWGTTGTAQAFAPPGATSIALGTVRLLIGGIALLSIALGKRSFRRSSRWPVGTTLIAGICIAGYQLSFLAAVAETGVAAGTIVAIGSAPVLAGGLAWLVEGTRPGSRWTLATILAVISCGLLAFSKGDVTFRAWGIVLALAAGGCYAVYALASKRLLRNHPPEAVMAVLFCVGALILSPFLWFVDLSWLLQANGLAVALHLGIVTTAVAYTLFGRGLKTVPTASAVTLSLAEPLTAGLLGVFLLNEQLAPAAWVGIGLLFAALGLLSF